MSAIILDEVYLIILDEIYLMKYPPIKQFPDDLQQFQDNVIRHSRAYHAARKVAEKSVDAGGLGMSVEESKKYAKDEAQKALAVAGVF
jgi:hypothetical protein